MASSGGDSRVMVDEAVLEKRLIALESARAWTPRVVSRLETRIRTGEDFDLFRVNAVGFATANGLSEAEGIDLFLHAAKVGLFDMEWNVVCAVCANTFASLRSLEKVDPHFSCDLCGLQNDATLDDYIQVTFTVAPAVRRIAYHDPGSLDIEDLYFRYHYSRDTQVAVAGMTVPQLLRQLTRYLDFIEPGATASVDVALTGAMIAIRDILHAATALYRVSAPGTSGDEGSGAATGVRRAIHLRLAAGGFEDREESLRPFGYDLAVGRFEFGAAGDISSGPVTIEIENALAERAAVWLVEYPEEIKDSLPIAFEPVLSAKQVLSTQTFRTLFRSETVASSEGLAIKDLTFVFTDLKDSTEMYDRIGDATAYNVVRQHFDALESSIRDHGGAIVKTIGDAVMATFVRPADAVRAALEMTDALVASDRSGSTQLALKVGIHRGRAIAVSSNDHLDYFGQAVNIAARIQGLAGASEIYMSEAVFRAPGVAAALGGRAVTEQPAIMKGVAEALPVFRVDISEPGGF